jgi:pyrimidine-nucleoside phosphorylase
MLESGTVLRHPGTPEPKVDKHSTGGVGDKISICLAPLVAAAGVRVPMISGRGLGHTGGTLDKLEAIPGFSISMSSREFERQVRKLGVAMIGQTDDLAPADRRIYALRDVTATVESIPLIVASILSKKLAEGIDALVLDVKVGRGAFMKDRASARALASALLRVGKGAGLSVRALLTNMNTPIGLTIGNALETREALELLHGVAPSDTRELTLALGVEMLLCAGTERSRTKARARLEAVLASGAAVELMAKMVHAQGGDERCVFDPSRLPRVGSPVPVTSKRSGVVSAVDPLELAHVSLGLGAGRRRAEDPVDPKAGIELEATVGTRVKAGDVLCTLHASERVRAERLVERARQAFRIGGKPDEMPLILERRVA